MTKTFTQKEMIPSKKTLNTLRQGTGTRLAPGCHAKERHLLFIASLLVGCLHTAMLKRRFRSLPVTDEALRDLCSSEALKVSEPSLRRT